MILPKWLTGRGKADAAAARPSGIPMIEHESTPPLLYAIGDVHGCYDKLVELEDRIFEDAAGCEEAVLVILGDFIDRGPDTSRVVDRLMSRTPNGIKRLCLKGNHESTMLGYFAHPSADAAWLGFGGAETLQSYGIDPGAWRLSRLSAKKIRFQIEACVPTEHVEFVSQLPLLIRFGSVVFAHAGIDRRKTLDKQTENDLLWVRPDPENDIPPRGDRYLVVHGHTPVPQAFVSPYRINLDTGAYADGPLSGAKLVNGRLEKIITST